MSTPITLHEADLIGRVHTIYSHDGHALFDFIIDQRVVTISGRAMGVKNTKQQLKDYPLGEQNGN